MPKSVAIMPMKMVSTIRSTIEQQRLARRAAAQADAVWRASTRCGWSLPFPRDRGSTA